MANEKPTMPPSRALVINVFLSALISCSVFVVVAWLVLVPQMARQEAEIRELRANVMALQSALDAATAEPAMPPVPPPAAPPAVQAAVAPATAPTGKPPAPEAPAPAAKK
jgi:hypothetical protein